MGTNYSSQALYCAPASVGGTEIQYKTYETFHFSAKISDLFLLTECNFRLKITLKYTEAVEVGTFLAEIRRCRIVQFN